MNPKELGGVSRYCFGPIPRLRSRSHRSTNRSWVELKRVFFGNRMSALTTTTKKIKVPKTTWRHSEKPPKRRKLPNYGACVLDYECQRHPNGSCLPLSMTFDLPRSFTSCGDSELSSLSIGKFFSPNQVDLERVRGSVDFCFRLSAVCVE